MSKSILGLSRLLVRGFCAGTLVFAPSASADTVTYNIPGTVDWTVPANVSSVTMELRGGGGAGGAAVALVPGLPSNGNWNIRGGGGAGGNYSRTVNFPVTPGTVFKVTVGAGGISPPLGTFVQGTPLTEQTGGSSSFKSADETVTHALATGGIGGRNGLRDGTVVNQSSTTATSAGSLGNSIVTGGNGGGASSGGTGGGGGGAGNTTAGGNGGAGPSGAGAAGVSGGGLGAAGTTGLSAPSGDGIAGAAPGGGGSGSARNTQNATFTAIGGAGGAGSVLLTYTIDTGVTKYAVTSASSSVAVGAIFDVIVTAQDNSNATIPDSINPVTMTSPTPESLMEFDWNGDGTFGDNSGTLVAGVKTIKARNKKAQTVPTVASAGPITTPTPLSITTTAGAFAKLQLLAPGETAAAGTATGKTGASTGYGVGVAFNVTVNAVDEFWNFIGTVTDTVAITSTDGIATLPADAPLALGSVVQSVTLNTPGLQTLTASDVTQPLITANTSSNISVTAVGRTWAASIDYLWDTTTANWTGGDLKFANLHAVTFGNTGAGFIDINSGTVAPFSILVNATSSDYEFANGSITGMAGGLTKAQAGTLVLDTNNSYTGPTTVNGGVLRLKNANALPATTALTLNSGILGLQGGDFTRALGTGPGQVVLTAENGGFAAFEVDRFVNLGGASAQLTWGTGGFFNAGGKMTLGNANASNTIDFQNPININGGDKLINVPDGGAGVDAIISGAITNSGAATNLQKAEAGTLMLSGVNAWGNELRILQGKVMLGGNTGIVIGDTSNVQLGAGGAGSGVTFDLNGRSETIATLNLGGQNTSTPPFIDGGNQHAVINSGAPAVLTINGLNYFAFIPNGIPTTDSQNGQATVSADIHTGTGNKNFTVYDSLFASGALVEEVVVSGALTGASITKLQAGTLVLTNPLYNENTTVSAGTLIVRKTGAQTNANPNNDASTVTIAETGAILNLDYSGTDTVGGVTIGATTYTSGILAGFAGPGITQVPQITGTGTLTLVAPPTDPFLTWAGNNPSVLFDGDSNNDGVKNGLAWLLGAANPNANATGLLPVVTQTGGSLKMTFDMLPASVRDGAQLFVEHSSDLGIGDPWSVGVLVPDATGGTVPVTFTVADIDPVDPNNKLDVEVNVSSTEAAAGKLFGRLRAER